MLSMLISSAMAQLTFEEAADRLQTAETFQGDAIGFAGELSPNVEAYRVVVAHPDGPNRLRELANSATLVGRLYAVAGLVQLGAPVESEVRELDALGDTRVPTRFGCLGGDQTVAELLRTSRTPRVELEKGVSLEAWFQKHRSGNLDILHGGYPASFTN